MVWLRPLDFEHGTHGCVLKPRELLKRKEILLVIEQKPESVGSDADDFSA
jgi:hypothetical protein